MTFDKRLNRTVIGSSLNLDATMICEAIRACGHAVFASSVLCTSAKERAADLLIELANDRLDPEFSSR